MRLSALKLEEYVLRSAMLFPDKLEIFWVIWERLLRKTHDCKQIAAFQEKKTCLLASAVDVYQIFGLL